MTTIQNTRDYTRFHKIDGNRRTNKAHVRSLTEALAEKAHLIALNPILVNEDGGIIDGQHRFEAIKQLGQPVYYIQGKNLTLEDVQSLNASSKNWSPIDFAKSFADLGDSNYEMYLNFKKEFGLNHDILLDYLSLDLPMTAQMFRKGLFKVTDPISRSWDLAACHRDTGQYYDGYKRRSYAFAFHKIWDNPEYNHKQMLHKLNKYGHLLQDYALTADYLRKLEEIYNRNVPKNKTLRFF